METKLHTPPPLPLRVNRNQNVALKLLSVYEANLTRRKKCMNTDKPEVLLSLTVSLMRADNHLF